MEIFRRHVFWHKSFINELFISPHALPSNLPQLIVKTYRAPDQFHTKEKIRSSAPFQIDCIPIPVLRGTAGSQAHGIGAGVNPLSSNEEHKTAEWKRAVVADCVSVQECVQLVGLHPSLSKHQSCRMKCECVNIYNTLVYDQIPAQLITIPSASALRCIGRLDSNMLAEQSVGMLPLL